MLYRFAPPAATPGQGGRGRPRPPGLPAGAVTGFQSWRTTRAEMVAKLECLLPMVIAFGVLARPSRC